MKLPPTLNYLQRSEKILIRLDDTIYEKYFKVDFSSNKPGILSLVEFLSESVGANRRSFSIRVAIQQKINESIKINNH